MPITNIKQCSPQACVEALLTNNETPAQSGSADTYKECGCGEVLGNMFALTSLGAGLAAFGGVIKKDGPAMMAERLAAKLHNSMRASLRMVSETEKAADGQPLRESRWELIEYREEIYHDIPERFKKTIADEGHTAKVADVANLDLERLPRKYRSEVMASATSAVQVILNEHTDGDVDVESVASRVHEGWRARRRAENEFIDTGFDVPYDELYEEDKARYRVIVNEAVGVLDEPLIDPELLEKTKRSAEPHELEGRKFRERGMPTEAVGAFERAYGVWRDLLLFYRRSTLEVNVQFKSVAAQLVGAYMDKGDLDGASKKVREANSVMESVYMAQEGMLREFDKVIDLVRRANDWFEKNHPSINVPAVKGVWERYGPEMRASLVQELLLLAAGKSRPGAGVEINDKTMSSAIETLNAMEDESKLVIGIGPDIEGIVSKFKVSLRRLNSLYLTALRGRRSGMEWVDRGTFGSWNISVIWKRLKEAESVLDQYATTSLKIAPAVKFKAFRDMWLAVRKVRTSFWNSGALSSNREIAGVISGIREIVRTELGIEGKLTNDALREAGVRMGVVERPELPKPPPESGGKARKATLRVEKRGREKIKP